MEECEDAFDYSLASGRFAIADGATESSFSDRWATALVRQYQSEPPFGNPPSVEAMAKWMLPLQKAWHASVDWAALPWFAEEKAQRGAFAAFLGLEFRGIGTMIRRRNARLQPQDEVMWNAFAVGDCCLFQVRDNSLLCAFPLEKSSLFDSRPILLASNQLNNTSALNDIRAIEGTARVGDIFFLASDALSKWLLAQNEAGEPPWDFIQAVRQPQLFEEFIQSQRKNRSMRNDDVTLLILDCVAGGPPPARKSKPD